jgi:hypothetical protein
MSSSQAGIALRLNCDSLRNLAEIRNAQAQCEYGLRLLSGQGLSIAKRHVAHSVKVSPARPGRLGSTTERDGTIFSPTKLSISTILPDFLIACFPEIVTNCNNLTELSQSFRNSSEPCHVVTWGICL